MATIVTNDYVDEQFINQVTGSATTTPSLLNNCSVGLCSINIAPTRTTTIAALEAGEPGFVGYARQPITWHAASRNDGGQIQALGTSGEFRPTNGTIPATVWAGFIVLSNSSLGGCWTFDDAPIPFNDQFNNLIITLAYQSLSGGVATDLP